MKTKLNINIPLSLKQGLLITAIAFIVYANSLGNDFALDDHAVILNNHALKGTIVSLFSTFDTVSDSQLLPFYRPFTYFTFLIEGRLHAFNPVFIRLFNVLLHSINALLVYYLARSFFRDNKYAALLAGLLFAVHPLQSEGVDFNAGGRNTMLATFFILSAYLTHQWSRNKESISGAFSGALMFFAGLLSKESALMILPLIVSLEFQTIRGGMSADRFRAFFRLAPYWIAASIYFVLRWLTLSKAGIQTSIVPGVGTALLESMYITESIGTRLLNNIYIIPRYLLTVIWPTSLTPRYVIPEDLNLFALPITIGWLCIIGATVWLFAWRRTHVSIFGFSWLILFWLPVSGIFLVPGAPLADRFLYIPAIGLWFIIAEKFGRLLQPDSRFARQAFFAALAIFLLLSCLTINRNLDWRNNMTLYTRFVKQSPDNVHARAGMGKVYYGKGKDRDITLAEKEFKIVANMEPAFPMIFTYLGNINLEKNDLGNALYYYGKAIEVYPYDKEARINRGITLERLGRPKEALSEYIYFMTSPGNSDHLPGGQEHAEKKVRELSQ